MRANPIGVRLSSCIKFFIEFQSVLTTEEGEGLRIDIHTMNVPNGETRISRSASDIMHVTAERSSNEAVDRIRALAAALISECEIIGHKNKSTARRISSVILSIKEASTTALNMAACPEPMPITISVEHDRLPVDCDLPPARSLSPM